jgi:hypothetical protein
VAEKADFPFASPWSLTTVFCSPVVFLTPAFFFARRGVLLPGASSTIRSGLRGEKHPAERKIIFASERSAA